MKISGSYTLALPQERVYAIMQDPAVLAKAIPGCEGLEQIGEDEYSMKMKMARELTVRLSRLYSNVSNMPLLMRPLRCHAIP